MPPCNDPVAGTVSATLNSRPGRTYQVQLYESGACHATGHGEAEVYLGWLDVTTNGAGDGAFSMPATVTPNAWLTMLATDPDGNTSELSQCFQAAAPPSLLFSDGFESGNLGAWSTVMP